MDLALSKIRISVQQPSQSKLTGGKPEGICSDQNWKGTNIYYKKFFWKSASFPKENGYGKSFLVSCGQASVAFTAVALGSIPGQGTKIFQATRHGQKRKKEKQAMSDPQKGELND